MPSTRIKVAAEGNIPHFERRHIFGEAILVLLHRGFDCLGVSRIERGQVGIGYLDSDAPGGAGLA